ncbi:thymidylate kinase-domain-containing protein [Xylariaceae sp. FL0255]|nr:thymidylate kinase-domain-containing protein [Xylariaceae sp. FL0255]
MPRDIEQEDSPISSPMHSAASPSPSTQLQEQAREAHAQETTQPTIIAAAGGAGPSTPPRKSSTGGADYGGSGTANSTSSAGGSIHVKASPPSPTSIPGPSSSSGPVLAAPQISPKNPAQATIPPRPSSPGEGMEGVEYGESVAGKGKGESSKSTQRPPVRGTFLVFEGMDRAGKTTQAKLLQMRCIESGREVKFMRFPDRTTPIGQMIDAYLKGQSEVEDHVIHLLFTANRWEAAQKIKANLNAGHTVICDRYYHSGIVYSAAKQLPSLSLSWAKAPEVGLPRPDMVLFLDLEEEVARRRGGWGGEIYEKGEMQRRVRELFWGLSMGDLGTAVRSTSRGPSSSRKASLAGNGGQRSGGVATVLGGIIGSGSGGAGVVGAGNEDEEAGGEFRQEEEDIHIVDANLDVEELSDKVWEVVSPRLEAVERGEVGKTVRIVR